MWMVYYCGRRGVLHDTFLLFLDPTHVGKTEPMLGLAFVHGWFVLERIGGLSGRTIASNGTLDTKASIFSP